MAKDKHNDKTKPNIEAIASFRLKGKHIEGRTKGDKGSTGQVVKKSDFPNNAAWQNLVNMEPPRAAETADKVGPAKPSKPEKQGKDGKLPGA